ncbi:hypothetical protein KKA95_00770 [Patescibacteria group bacterium]|nr:hypothetical protein [Patescibacteria group bacterium]
MPSLESRKDPRDVANHLMLNATSISDAQIAEELKGVDVTEVDGIVEETLLGWRAALRETTAKPMCTDNPEIAIGGCETTISILENLRRRIGS